MKSKHAVFMQTSCFSQTAIFIFPGTTLTSPQHLLTYSMQVSPQTYLHALFTAWLVGKGSLEKKL